MIRHAGYRCGLPTRGNEGRKLRARDLSLTGANGGRLRADAWGDPASPPVLFLHGGGQTRHAWGGTAAAIARDGRYAVTLDMRGHGESDWDPEGDYRLEGFAADLEAVLSHFASPPAVVGASLGGLATLLVAGEAEHFAGAAVVLVDVAPRIERKGANRIIEFMTSRPDGYASLEDAADAIAVYTKQRRRARDLKGLEKNLRRGEDGRYRWHWDPAFVGARGPGALLDRVRLLAAAANLRVPTLLVRGRESDVLSREGVNEMLATAPHAEFVDVSGAGHMVAGDRNDAFTAAVADFLRRRVPL